LTVQLSGLDVGLWLTDLPRLMIDRWPPCG